MTLKIMAAKVQEDRVCARCSGARLVVERGVHSSVARRCPACFDTCPQCNGTRFFFSEDWTGQTVSQPCDCQRIDRVIRLYNSARIPRLYDRADLVSGVDDVTPSVKSARLACFKFTKDFQPGARGIGLIGTVGTGKSHIMAATVRELTFRNGVGCRFIEFSHLLAELKRGFDEGNGNSDLMQDLVTVPVLVIDELGKGLATDWKEAVLDELISKRYNNSVTTCFTSNFHVEAPGGNTRTREGFERISLVEKVGERIYSRLVAMCEMITIEAPDYRKSHQVQP